MHWSWFKRFNIHSVAIIAGVLILNSGCETKSRELRSMSEDPLVNTDYVTAFEVNRVARDKEKSLGKKLRATLSVDYSPLGDLTTQDVFDEIVSTAESGGWLQRNKDSTQEGFYTAISKHDSFDLLLEVLIPENKQSVRVRLENIASQ